VKVFVTGASGFVGEEILRQLHAAGYDIRILARKEKSSAVQSAAARFKVEIHPGDVTDAQTLSGALTGCDAVIHLVGIISEAGKSTYENIHTRGTQNMVAAAQSAGVRRFIYMSALGTRPNAVARYHQSKWAAEDILRNSGLDYTIFRPSIIYGPHDHFVNLFASLSRFSPVLPVIGDGRAKLQPVPVADVARCFVGALSEPRSIGQTFDLAGRDVLSFEQVLDAILEITHRKRWKMHVPLGIARLQATLLEKVFPLFGKTPPLNRDQLLMLQEDNVGDAKSADESYKLSNTTFKEGIAAYLTLRN
jgi:NADH dehydrogenase